MREESGVEVTDAQLHANIVFDFHGHPERLEVHVFRATRWTGEPRECDEMRPQWFPDSAIPYEMMWLDDAHWLPLLLAGKRFVARFLFRGHTEILEHDVRELRDGEPLPRSEGDRLVTAPQGAITAS